MIDGTRLLLARHGRHDWLAPPINRLAGHLPGVHINAQGRAEAQALARRLAARPPDRIVSSPVERTLQTATIISEAVGVAVATDARLTETGMGVWEGLAIAEVIARFPNEWRAWRTAPTHAAVPGMERVDAIGERMLAAAQDYLALGGSTLLVSHQDPLLALICRLLDLPLDAMRRMEVSPGSLTIFEVARGRPVLVTLNSIPRPMPGTTSAGDAPARG
ncbi:MAG: histidine phosphatase family protein [Armatimonadota bacterium]|nr:histidine phosphatase family protein [Armatimonadota bacterium]